MTREVSGRTLTGTYKIVVADRPANIVAHLAALQTQVAAGLITAIVLTGSTTTQAALAALQITSVTPTVGTAPTLVITAAQFTADAGALSKIVSTYNVSVSRVSAANAISVGANAHVTSMTVTDRAANVAANITALQAQVNAGRLTSISLTDAGTPGLSVTAAQLMADAGAFAKIAGHPFLLNITDATANLQAVLPQLLMLDTNGQLGKVHASDGVTARFNLTPAQLTQFAPVLGKMMGAFGEFVVADANISEALKGTAGGNNTLSFLSASRAIMVDVSAGTAATVAPPPISGTPILAGIQIVSVTPINVFSDTISGFKEFIAPTVAGSTFAGAAKDIAGDTLQGLMAGDAIDIKDLSPSLAKYNFTSSVSGISTATFTDGTHTASLKLAGSLNNILAFNPASDGHGGTVFTALNHA